MSQINVNRNTFLEKEEETLLCNRSTEKSNVTRNTPTTTTNNEN